MKWIEEKNYFFQNSLYLPHLYTDSTLGDIFMLLQTVNLVPLIAPLTLKDNTANLAFREEEKAEGGWWMVGGGGDWRERSFRSFR